MLKIGNVKIKNPLVLAPMADVTSISFRMLCKDYGAAFAVTEMVNANAIERGNASTFKTAKVYDEERPVALQLVGQRNEAIVKAATILEKEADIIDFNCGCPVKKVMNQGAGAALLKKPTKLSSIIKDVTSVLSVPFTVKIRAGLTRKSINAVKTAQMIENAGAAAVCLHARTQDQGYSGKADWSLIKDVVEGVSIPVVGNGDVSSAEDCKTMLDSTGCSFVMIGRGAQKNPYLFKQCLHYLEKGELLPDQTFVEKLADFRRYIAYSEKYSDVDFVHLKRRAMDFSKGARGGSVVRNKLMTAKTTAELLDFLRELE